MKIIVCKDEVAVGKVASGLTLAAMAKANAHISITGGASPKKMYEYMIPMVKDNPLYEDVHYYNFDEIPQVNEPEGLTMRALRSLFFQPAQIKESQIHILDEHNYEACEAHLASIDQLDYVVMGLGKDGHFCGNLPNTCHFQDATHAVSCRLNDTLYKRICFLSNDCAEKVPPYYVTMGPKTMMRTKQVVMIVTGAEKSEIAKKVFFEEVNEAYPSSIFQLHPNFTLVIDEAAAKLFPNHS